MIRLALALLTLAALSGGAALAQSAPAEARPVPRESESNAVTGITVERFIGDAALAAPRIIGNAMLARTILSKGDPSQPGWPGALLVHKSEIFAAGLEAGEATSMMQQAEQWIGYVKAGQGTLDDGKQRWALKPGFAFLVPAGLAHRIAANGDGALQMTILAGPPQAGATPSPAILVRDSAKLLYVEQGAHWVNLSKAPFRDVGERFLLVYMAPMTVAGAHAHVPGTEEAWIKLTAAPALLQVGSEIRQWKQDQGFVVPPNGRTVHAAINHSDQRQAWFYFSTMPRPAGPPRPAQVPDPAFAAAIVAANVAPEPLVAAAARKPVGGSARP
ncbi:cupin domain-containing protein [Sandarakinorhabdus sp.]|uniref:cupin domain-containing protein n=1 Tax=Sandarakinorhabdus sp. TaxID=1916663 RepID=UPI0033406EC8